MVETYRHAGIGFRYPGNWRIEEDDAGWGNRSVSVTSPSNAFWMLTIHPSANRPDQLAAAAVDSLREEYDDIESEPITLYREGIELAGHEIHFFCLEFTSTACVLAFSDHRATYTILWQSEDGELVQNAAVFDAITTSFLQEIARKS